MRRLTSLLIGVFTVILFLGVGSTLLAGQRYWFGGAVVGLGVLRLVVWIRQVRWAILDAREEAEESDGQGPPEVP